MAPAQARPYSPLENLGLYAFLLFLFALFSRFFELTLPQAHIAAAGYYSSLLFLILTGSFLRALQSRIAAALMFFLAWILLGVPFAWWRGGTLGLFKGQILTVFSYYLLTWPAFQRLYRKCGKCDRTLPGQYRRLIGSHAGGREDQGRLALAYGKFNNPNEIAGILLLTLPFWLVPLFSKSFSLSGKLKSVFAVGAICLSVGVIFHTGSRAGELGLIAVFLFSLQLMPLSGKVFAIMAAGVFYVGALFLMPPELRERMLTFSSVEAGEDNQLTESAAGSTTARRQLLTESLRVTITHPVFGLGAGNFSPYEADLAKQMHRRATWLGTHNSYTQVASETGIPGVLIYLTTMFFCFRSLAPLRKNRGAPGIRALAVAIHLSLVGFCVSAFFAHIAYDSQFYIIAGLCVALTRCARDAMDMQQPLAPPPQVNYLLAPAAPRFRAPLGVPR